MNFIDTQFFQFLFKGIATLGFGIICKGLWSSAISSFKTAHKWTSVLDEIAVGLLVLFVYFIILMNPPSVLFNWAVNPIMFLWNMFVVFLRETLGLPI